jgi:hypothetical protein
MCFFICAEYTYLEQTEPISTLKFRIAESTPFKKYLSSHRETMSYMLQLITEMTFFGKIHAFFFFN